MRRRTAENGYSFWPTDTKQQKYLLLPTLSRWGEYRAARELGEDVLVDG